MTKPYRLFGAELSPYSVKVRSYFRYKNLPFEWLRRSPATEAEFRAHAKVPLIPLVITPEGQGIGDSTPIIEHFEARVPLNTLSTGDPVADFISALIEEYADEWMNKAMFHYRWTYEPDRKSGAERIARMMLGDEAPAEQLEGAAKMIRERMVPRLRFVGSHDGTREQIERSYRRVVDIVERHLVSRPYLFGARPTLADFGLWGQLYELWSDPTPGALMKSGSPRTCAYVERMLNPKAEGPFEKWSSLEPTLMPLLKDEIAGIFLPWSQANTAALAKGEETFTVALEGVAFNQQPQKYHARSLAALKQKYYLLTNRVHLDAVLERAGCLKWLKEA